MTEPTEPVPRDVGTAERLAGRLDRPMSVLGLVFLLVVLAQVVADNSGLQQVLTVVGWLLWGVFVGEFVLRAWVAKDQRRFWRRNWWQVVFLAVPFLRFARALTLLRVTRAARAGAVLSAAVRGSRSGGRLLSGRVTWLALVTAVVVLAVSQLLYVLGYYDSYAVALHESALATVTGTALDAEGAFPRSLEVALAVYSVVVFATLAGALGAYFLDRPSERSTDRAAWTPHMPWTPGPGGVADEQSQTPGSGVR